MQGIKNKHNGRCFAIKITENIHIVGSGMAGCSMSDAYDCNVYLINSGESLSLIDTGSGISPELIVDEIVKDGLDPNLISNVFLTHGHADHSAGAKYFFEQFKASIYGGKETASFINSGDLDALSLNEAIKAGLYPEDYTYDPCSVIGLNEGEIMNLGNMELHVVDLPGHSVDHVGYLFQHEGNINLFSGDLIFRKGRISLLATWDCSLVEYKHSVKKLYDYKVNSLFPGHSSPILHDAHSHIAMGHHAFQNLEVPKNFG